MDIQGNDDTPTLAIIIVVLFCLEFIISCLYALVKMRRLWKRKGQKKRSKGEPEPKEWEPHPMQVFRIIRREKARVSGLLFAVFEYDCVDDDRTYGATLVRLAGLSIQAIEGEIQLYGWINTEVVLEAEKVLTFCSEFYRDYYWQFRASAQKNTDGDVRAIVHPGRLAICAGPSPVAAVATSAGNADATIAAATAPDDEAAIDVITAAAVVPDVVTDAAVATTATPFPSTDASTTHSSAAPHTPLHILLGCNKSPHVPYLWATGLAVCLITKFIRN